MTKDEKGLWAEAQMVSEKPWHFMQIQPKKIISLIERIAQLEAEIERSRNEVLARQANK
jgi:hypothetical protein